MKFKILFAIFVVTFSAFSQAPQGFSYQAVVRNNSNVLLANTNVGMQISILQGSSTGTAVYVERHTTTTNTNGLATLSVGSGVVQSGVFSTINWNSGLYFIKTETDSSGGTSYTITGTSQMLSVPYALNSKTSEDNKWVASDTNISNLNTGNVGIGVSNPTEKLEIAGNTKTNGLIVPTGAISGRVLTSDAIGNATWQNINTSNLWNTAGNTLTETGIFGTLSNNHVDLFSNNINRGRLTNLGEFFIGATNTTIIGDLFGVVSNTTFPFAVNGYSGFNGAGVYGAVTSGNTKFGAVLGEYLSNTAGNFNTAGVSGSNSSTSTGTGFRRLVNSGPRMGISGATTSGNGQYTFGVHGSMGSTDIRCGAILGDDFGLAFGALGYYAANLIDYSVYGFGNAFQTGIATGKLNQKNIINTHIGLGIYGGVMGGWIRGSVYGTHLTGERYSLYVDGNTFTNKPIIELIENTDGTRTPNYAITTAQPEIFVSGKSALIKGKKYIEFTSSFSEKTDSQNAIITITPIERSKGIFIAGQDSKGFYVEENEEGALSNINFSWIAIAQRKDIDIKNIASELLNKNFDTKMRDLMSNENDKNAKVQSLWWDGNNVRFDNPPARQELLKNIETQYIPIRKKD